MCAQEHPTGAPHRSTPHEHPTGAPQPPQLPTIRLHLAPRIVSPALYAELCTAKLLPNPPARARTLLLHTGTCIPNPCSSETAGAQADHHTAHTYGRVDEAGRYLGPKAGSTAAVAVVQGGKLFVAHAGDSRCVAEAAEAVAKAPAILHHWFRAK